jgi:predicted Zn finger-like uncharacterized protein
MSLATRCPICEALFRVTPDQLRARAGQVRCGRCNAVFDGLAHLAPERDHVAPPPGAHTGDRGEATPGEFESLDFSLDSGRTPLDLVTAAPEDPVAAAVLPERDAQAVPEMPSEPPEAADFLADQAAPVHRPWTHRWPMAIASALLALLLAAQFAIRNRDELAARYPGLRPLLSAPCAVFGCELGLPRRADRLSIEGDEMIAADPREPSRVTLIATLRNTASFPVAYPHLDLSLQNEREQVLARRTLGPADYLEAETDVPQGLAPNGEVNLRLALDTGTVRADGYRVLVFYPRTP